ncbi:metal-dependent protease molecular chaperone [Klebsiella pneumoniae]|uniref:tRNA threonylcarbamoyladenosine biosynthesis protein TsaB n=1 Tax=Klebsiella pneumoniae TaxID=573 RepID=A0A2X3EP13_KLEPN|nr:metal-dependent protease molecular chaperone [Klebsiella pneumoniae]
MRIGIGIAQGLALGAELPMIGVSTLATMAQGAWRKTGATRVLAAIDARMGEVYWAEYQRDEQGVWHGEETEAVLKPDAVAERLAQLSGRMGHRRHRMAGVAGSGESERTDLKQRRN